MKLQGAQLPASGMRVCICGAGQWPPAHAGAGGGGRLGPPGQPAGRPSAGARRSHARPPARQRPGADGRASSLPGQAAEHQAGVGAWRRRPRRRAWAPGLRRAPRRRASACGASAGVSQCQRRAGCGRGQQHRPCGGRTKCGTARCGGARGGPRRGGQAVRGARGRRRACGTGRPAARAAGRQHRTARAWPGLAAGRARRLLPRLPLCLARASRQHAHRTHAPRSDMLDTQVNVCVGAVQVFQLCSCYAPDDVVHRSAERRRHRHQPGGRRALLRARGCGGSRCARRALRLRPGAARARGLLQRGRWRGRRHAHLMVAAARPVRAARRLRLGRARAAVGRRRPGAPPSRRPGTL